MRTQTPDPRAHPPTTPQQGVGNLTVTDRTAKSTTESATRRTAQHAPSRTTPGLPHQSAAETPATGPSRRSFLQYTGAIVGGSLVAGCLGEQAGVGDDGPWVPNAETRLIVPYPPGGGFDTYTRMLQPYYQQHLPGDSDVLVDNRGGAGGLVGTRAIYEADPDGYTHGIWHGSAMLRSQVVEDVPFDLTELTHFAQIGISQSVFVTGPHTGITTYEEFVDEIHDLRYGIVALTSTPAFAGVLWAEFSGDADADQLIDNFVSLDGTAEIISAMLAGDVDATAFGHPLLSDHGDTLNPIINLSLGEPGVTGFPDLPTLDSQGVDNADTIVDLYPTRRFLSGPPGIDDERAQLVHDTYDAAINDEEFLAEMNERDQPVDYEPGARVADIVESGLDRWEQERDLLETLLG